MAPGQRDLKKFVHNKDERMQQTQGLKIAPQGTKSVAYARPDQIHEAHLPSHARPLDHDDIFTESHNVAPFETREEAAQRPDAFETDTDSIGDSTTTFGEHEHQVKRSEPHYQNTGDMHNDDDQSSDKEQSDGNPEYEDESSQTQCVDDPELRVAQDLLGAANSTNAAASYPSTSSEASHNLTVDRPLTPIQRNAPNSSIVVSHAPRQQMAMGQQRRADGPAYAQPARQVDMHYRTDARAGPQSAIQQTAPEPDRPRSPNLPDDEARTEFMKVRVARKARDSTSVVRNGQARPYTPPLNSPHKPHQTQNRNSAHENATASYNRPTRDDRHAQDRSTTPRQRYDHEAATSGLEDRDVMLDYAPEELYSMEYAEIKKQPFDFAPHATHAGFQSPDELTQSLAKVAEMNPAGQAHFFATLTMEEWEDAGGWFQEQFSGIMTQLRQARRKKRKLALEFEAEVEKRHEAVMRKKRLTDEALQSIKENGGKVLQGTPKKR